MPAALTSAISEDGKLVVIRGSLFDTEQEAIEFARSLGYNGSGPTLTFASHLLNEEP